jgi:N-acetylglutamate synthase
MSWVYCMATVAEHQRRGHGRRLLNLMAEWTLAKGGETMCLQVMGDNVAARSLYGKAGFRIEYNYHYRVRK